MKHVNPDELYLSASQVAKRFGVSKDTIWRWKREGKFPKGVKIGGSTRWRLSDLLEHEGQLQACFAMHIKIF